MIFEALDKIKRNAIFSAILLMALGAVLLLCPEAYVPTLIIGFGYALAIIALVIMLTFFQSKKSLLDYIKFVAGIALLLGAICILIYRNDAMRVLAYSFGVLLVIDGGHSLLHSITYSRRSHKKGWWILSILSILIMFVGVMLFLNPWFSTEKTLIRAIGLSLLFASIISALRMIWTWPVEKEDEEDGEVNQNA